MALQTKTITANGAKGHHKFTLNVNEDSINAANNTSAISWSFVLSPIVKGYDWYYSASKPVEYTVTINGVATSGVIYNYDGSSTVTVKTGSTTVSHNADGTKSISVSFSVTSLNVSYLTGAASASGTMALTAISRGVTITSAPDFTDADNPTITYIMPSGSTVTSMQACISLGEYDDVPYRNITSSGTYTFNLTDAERATLNAGVTSGSTVSVKFYIKSVVNGQTYRHYVTKTYSITGSSLIKITPTLTDTNSTTAYLTGNSSSIFVRYASNVAYTVGASAASGGSITKYSAKNGSTAYTTASGTFKNITSDTFTFSATDNRGNTATKNVQVTLVPYVKLTCSVKSSSGISTSGTATVTVSGQYYRGSFGSRSNSLSISARAVGNYGTSTSYYSSGITYGEDSYTATLTFYNLNYQDSYSFVATASDSVMSISSQESGAVTGTTVFDWSKNDFAFNVPVTIQGYDVPTIVDEGTSGIWTYRKWSSGIAECWGTLEFTADVATSTNANWFSSGELTNTNISFPFTFVERPMVNAQTTPTGQSWCIVFPSNTTGSTTKTGSYQLMSTTSKTAGKHLISYDVKGWWK